MTTPRKQQVCLDSTPYYHCICRCVRRAYLCGDDKSSGQNFDHRKQWLVDKITDLSAIFSIELCAYAIMSNHYHLVLRVNKSQAQTWSDEEVALRWKQLFKGHILVDRWLSDTVTTQAEKDKALEFIALCKKRLIDISWFMRSLNEPIARQANKEDNCTGHLSDKRAAFLLLALLRTVHAGFPAHGSSLSKPSL
jgi:REP element-mobilizing transposase RayT